MSQLPPELLTQIFELSLLPGSSRPLQEFADRSSNLRVYAQVCRQWQPAAERLLYRDPVLKISSTDSDRLNKLLVVSEMERIESVETRHLHVFGQDDISKLPLMAGTQLAANLTALSLWRINVDPNIFTSLPSLQSLAFFKVSFKISSTPTPPNSLLRLTDLSLGLVKFPLPLCLYPSRLPSLKRLALHTLNGMSGVGLPPYSLPEILDIQDRLDFISFSTKEDFLYSHESFSFFAEKTILTLHRKLYLFWDFEGLVKSPFVRHIKMAPGEHFGAIMPNGVVDKPGWYLEKMRDLVVDTFPKLRTIVIPSRWREAIHYEEFMELAKERGVTVLYEEESYRTNGGSLISVAFREHRAASQRE